MRKSAHAIWKIAEKQKWHLDDNPVISAHKVIEHAMEENIALVSENVYESGVCCSHMSYGLGLHLCLLQTVLRKWGSVPVGV